MEDLKDFDIREDWESWKSKLDLLEKAEGLDKYCNAILLFFEIYPKQEFGSNELFKKINEFEKATKIRFTKPTLYHHLNHLIERGFIEFREDFDSNYVIKPKYYRLKDLWSNIFGSGKYKDYTQIESEFEGQDIDYITYSFMKKTVNSWVRYYIDSINNPHPFDMLFNGFNVKMLTYLVDTYTKIIIGKKQEQDAIKLMLNIQLAFEKTIDDLYRSDSDA